jgi:hypothetical protein
MTIVLILLVVLLVAGIAYFARKNWTEKSASKEYLDKMVHFFEGELSAIPGSDNSKRISFKYRGYDCLFEDMELPALQKGATSNVAFLKVKAQSTLNLSFTERERTSIRSNAQTLAEVTQSRWGDTRGLIELPKSLEDYHVYTNDPERATKFIKNKKVLRSFESYRNRDQRGHPLISLKVAEGFVVLEFHAHGGLTPSIFEIQNNVTATEAYLQELIGLVEVLQTLTGEKSS